MASAPSGVALTDDHWVPVDEPWMMSWERVTRLDMRLARRRRIFGNYGQCLLMIKERGREAIADIIAEEEAAAAASGIAVKATAKPKRRAKRC